MYSVQKGILPVITSIVSFALPIWVVILDLKYIFENINARIPQIMGDSTKPVWLVITMLLFFTMFFPLFFGLLLASIFPVIEIRRDGLNFCYWTFFNCKVKWQEIDSLIYYQNGYIILRIDKRGLSIFNGLYFNSLQARFIRSQLPILVFSPGLENRNEIIKEILGKGTPRIVNKE